MVRSTEFRETPVGAEEAGLDGTIAVEVDEGLNVSVFRVAGNVSADEFVRVIESHFPVHPTDHSIWDLTDAVLSGLDKVGIVKIAEASRAVTRYRRADGRTAIVASRSVERVLLKIYADVNQLQGSPRDYRFYDNYPDALAWIRDGAGPVR